MGFGNKNKWMKYPRDFHSMNCMIYFKTLHFNSFMYRSSTIWHLSPNCWNHLSSKSGFSILDKKNITIARHIAPLIVTSCHRSRKSAFWILTVDNSHNSVVTFVKLAVTFIYKVFSNHKKVFNNLYKGIRFQNGCSIRATYCT